MPKYYIVFLGPNSGVYSTYAEAHKDISPESIKYIESFVVNSKDEADSIFKKGYHSWLTSRNKHFVAQHRWEQQLTSIRETTNHNIKESEADLSNIKDNSKKSRRMNNLLRKCKLNPEHHNKQFINNIISETEKNINCANIKQLKYILEKNDCDPLYSMKKPQVQGMLFRTQFVDDSIK